MEATHARGGVICLGSSHGLQTRPPPPHHSSWSHAEACGPGSHGPCHRGSSGSECVISELFCFVCSFVCAVLHSPQEARPCFNKRGLSQSWTDHQMAIVATGIGQGTCGGRQARSKGTFEILSTRGKRKESQYFEYLLCAYIMF